MDSSVAFTMDTYSHIIEGMQEDAMALLDEVLPAGVNKNSVANLSPTFGDLASGASVAQGKSSGFVKLCLRDWLRLLLRPANHDECGRL